MGIVEEVAVRNIHWKNILDYGYNSTLKRILMHINRTFYILRSSKFCKNNTDKITLF